MSSDIREALDKASGTKTPWNPSRKAIAKVDNPLPAPDECPYCKGKVELVNNRQIYRRSIGDWPWAYLCINSACGAYVGLHPFTAIPLGTLANAELREWRKAAKDAFNPRWQDGPGKQISRSEAYAWLAGQMGIDKAVCHIGWFDIAACKRTLEICGVAPDKWPVDAASLIAKVRAMDENCDMVLTSKRQQWLDDILERADEGDLTLSRNSVTFLQQCAAGAFGEARA